MHILNKNTQNMIKYDIFILWVADVGYVWIYACM